MEYEEKYKEALKAIESLYNVVKYQSSSDALLTSQTIEKAFPELRESEDEKIRKGLIEHLNELKKQSVEGSHLKRPEHYDAWIAWLEKQGYQKHLELKAGHWYFCHQAYCERADILTVKEGETFKCEKDGVVKGLIIKEPEKYFREISAPSDKVEPKFKVGDWIVYNINDSSREILYVYDIRDGRYYFNDNIHCSWSVKECDEKCHLWTIKDTKEGDVLAAHECLVLFKKIDGFNIRCYCTYHFMNNPSFYVDTLQNKDAFHPATKEQCDILLQKMKESGYEWNVEKKELNKIEKQGEQKTEIEYIYPKFRIGDVIEPIKPNGDSKPVRVLSINKKTKSYCCESDDHNVYSSIPIRCENEYKLVEQKPAEWSEEDEANMDYSSEIIGFLNNYIKTYGRTAMNSWVNWLKSLKPQKHWKPSEQNIKDLEWCADFVKDKMGVGFHRLQVLIDELKNL